MVLWKGPGCGLGVHHTRGTLGIGAEEAREGSRKMGSSSWALKEGKRLKSALASLGAPRGQGLCLLHPVAPVSSRAPGID